VVTAGVTKLTYRDAITEALRIEMGRDPRVICVTRGPGSAHVDGLDQLFGAKRFVALDRAERTVVGIAAGLALEGSRPVCEIPAAELPSRGLDQLTEAVELHAREGIPVPIVVRVACGPAPAGGPLDPEGPERWLLSVTGLKVVAPANGADAKGLLAGAIRDPGPVCFLEQAGLYGDVGPVPEGGHVVPIGEANLIQHGTRMTLMAHGSAVAPAVEAAAELDDGIEVLELRTLAPLDEETILESVRRTGKALLVEETVSFSAVARAVTATVWDGAFEYLDAPLRRVSLAAPAPGEWSAGRVAAIKEACVELLAY
jgi:pyruvate/2-oxoglutarate/acetoin dehydrogenase E1 component